MRRVMVATLLLGAACGPGLDDLEVGAAPIEPGSAEAQGVLALVNDPATDRARLDDEAGLDRRAADNIVKRRDGRDGRPGTADDVPYASLEALDAVPYVGAAALARLLDYARGLGLVPVATDDDALILGVVNAADVSVALLDDAVGLDARAARGIFAHRAGPDGRLGTADDRLFPGVAAVDAVPYVGAAALASLLAYAKAQAGPPRGAAGEACQATPECQANLRCVGIPSDGSSPLGKCVDVRRQPGEGARCDQRTACAEGTLCAGTTLFGEGQCVPEWMAGRWSDATRRRLDDGAAVSSGLVVSGLASVPVDLTVTLSVQHERPQDLKVTLTDPNGSRAVLWDRSPELASGYARSFVTTGISRDDQVNGRWTLTVEDTVRGSGAGWIRAWDLFVVSRWD
jgi:hypothetical protein